MGEAENNKSNYGCWGLSLSLKPPITHLHHQKPMCKREPHFPTDEQSPKMHKPSNNNRLKMVPKIMGVEVKPAPLVIDLEEVDQLAKISSPNSTLSTTNAKRLDRFAGERDANSDDDEGGTSGGSQTAERKKLRLSKEQIMVLEQAFREHTTLNTKQKLALAKQVKLKPRQVEVWFQNRRARTKLKQTEVDCEYLRRFCENLSDENRKLHKEVQDLRALKISPDHQSLVQANHSPTALSICPSCKSISTTTGKTPTGEVGRYPSGIFHRPAPVNLKKLSLSIASNSSSKMFEAHLPRV